LENIGWIKLLSCHVSAGRQIQTYTEAGNVDEDGLQLAPRTMQSREHLLHDLEIKRLPPTTTTKRKVDGSEPKRLVIGSKPKLCAVA